MSTKITKTIGKADADGLAFQTVIEERRKQAGYFACGFHNDFVFLFNPDKNFRMLFISFMPGAVSNWLFKSIAIN